MKTWSSKSDQSVFDHVHYTAIWLKTGREKKVTYSAERYIRERRREKKC